MKCHPLFLSKLAKMSHLLSAAVVIGVLRGNCYDLFQRFYRLHALGFYFHFMGGSRGGGCRVSGTPLKKSQNIGFLTITGTDP